MDVNVDDVDDVEDDDDRQREGGYVDMNVDVDMDVDEDVEDDDDDEDDGRKYREGRDEDVEGIEVSDDGGEMWSKAESDIGTESVTVIMVGMSVEAVVA